MKKVLIIVMVALCSTLSMASTADSVKKKLTPFGHIYLSSTASFFNTPMSLRLKVNDSLGNGTVKPSIQFGRQLYIGKRNTFTIEGSFTGYRTSKVTSGNGYYYVDVFTSQILVQFNHHYALTEKSSLYTGLGLGVRFNDQTTYIKKGSTAMGEPLDIYKVAPTLNFTALGAQIASKHLGLRTELGFGTNGIVRVGLLWKI